MLHQRSGLSRGLIPVVVVALTLAIANPPARAAAPESSFEQLIAEADTHASEGRPQEALAAYGTAFSSMPPELRTSEVGEFVALAAAEAAMADYEQRKDKRSLEQGRMVLLTFVGQVDSAGPDAPVSIDAAKAQLAKLDAMMPKPEPVQDQAPPPTPEPEPEPAVDMADTPDRSRLGLGLAVGGGVAVLAGVGLVIAGIRQVPWYEQKLMNEGWLTDDVGYAEQLEGAERTRNIDLGVGVGLAVVGVGLAVGGGVLLSRSRGGAGGSVAITPTIGRDHGLLTVQGRF
jgi:hypothetical protein